MCMCGSNPPWLYVAVRDPCEEMNGGCAQLCVSADGHVQCSCRSGFTLAEDGKSCEGEEADTLIVYWALRDISKYSELFQKLF